MLDDVKGLPYCKTSIHSFKFYYIFFSPLTKKFRQWNQDKEADKEEAKNSKMIGKPYEASFNDLFLIPFSQIITNESFPLIFDLNSGEVPKVLEDFFDIVVSQ